MDEGDDEGDDEEDEGNARRAAFAKRKQTERESRRFSRKTPLHKRLDMASGGNAEFIKAWIDERVDRLSKLYVKGG